MHQDLPRLFISHRGVDKPRLQPILERLLKDGVSIEIDQVDEFTPDFVERLVTYRRAGQFHTIPGGTPWDAHIPAVIRSSACTLGFISNASFDPERPADAKVQLTEMSLALDCKRLIVVEFDTGAVMRYAGLGTLYARWITEQQYLPLRADRSDYDYGALGAAVARLTDNGISFGQDPDRETLVRLQADLAQRRKGSVAATCITAHNLGYPVQFQLIPGRGSKGAGHFWFSRAPVVDEPIDRSEVEAIMATASGVRLPSPDEVEWAVMAKLSRGGDANPFGLVVPTAAGIWASDGREPVIVGEAAAGGRALLCLIYDRKAGRAE